MSGSDKLQNGYLKAHDLQSNFEKRVSPYFSNTGFICLKKNYLLCWICWKYGTYAYFMGSRDCLWAWRSKRRIEGLDWGKNTIP